MKRWLQEKLICPECLADETPLDLEVREAQDDDVQEGELICPACGSRYAISRGVAVILPRKSMPILTDHSGYNSRSMLSAYLWSHFSEFFNGPDATDAYRVWSSLLPETSGCALDIGCSVGRLSFELSNTHSQVIGIDTSLSFIRKARELLLRNHLEFDLIIEGHITETRSCQLDQWNLSGVEFIVADALALPFPRSHFATVTSVNVLEKVPQPTRHLMDVNKVLRDKDAVFLFSDPFSWDEAVSDPELWLSGRNDGKYTGRGLDNMSRIFLGEDGVFQPPLEIRKTGDVVWKIRKTANLWEHINSQYIIGER